MNPTLRNLLVFAGVTIGGFGVYIAKSNSDPQAVKTAALADGFVARAAEAEVRASPAGLAWLADAGIVAPKYARLQFPVAVGVGKEWDGGDVVILPDLPFDKLLLVQDSAITTTTCAARPGVCPLYGDGRPFKVVGHACAWKPTAGAACTKSDGGDPGVQNTMQPGTFAGASCVARPCVMVQGDPE